MTRPGGMQIEANRLQGSKGILEQYSVDEGNK
jgi:hypothetical protein